MADHLEPFVDFLPAASMRDTIAPTERDAWRGRVYAVRYFITYVISGAAITMIALVVQPWASAAALRAYLK